VVEVRPTLKDDNASALTNIAEEEESAVDL
jgi:hypothetical protein